jgi:hypothetical protein
MAKSEDPELRKLRNDYDKARAKLLAAIRVKAAPQGPVPVAMVARSVDWSREYVAQIRDNPEIE